MLMARYTTPLHPRKHALWRLIVAMLGLLMAFGSNASASNNATFKHYGVDQGLPQSQVRVLHQDPSGYLWIGTQGGLARYNGREFTRFTSAEGLAGNQIESIASDSDGRLWVGTNLGLCVFEDPFFQCVESEKLNGHTIGALTAHDEDLWVGTAEGLLQLEPSTRRVEVHRLAGQNIGALAARSDGALWVGAGSELVRLQPDSGKVENLDRGDGVSAEITTLHPTTDGLWIGTDHGILVRESDGAVRQFGDTARLAEPPHVTGIVSDSTGGIVFGSHQGLYRIENDEADSIRQIQEPGNEIVRALLRDHEDTLWSGRDDGMHKRTPSSFVGYTRDDGLVADFVRAMAQDAENRLWLGTRFGVQIVPVLPSGLALDASIALTRADGLPNERIYAIEFMPDGSALLATNGGLVQLGAAAEDIKVVTEEDGLPSNHVRSLRRDARGRLWIGTAAGVVILEQGEVRAPPHPRLDDVYPLMIHIDDRRRVWFATRDHGLMRFDPASDRLVQRAGGDFSKQTIWDLAQAPDGSLWVGTNGDGLFHLDAEGGVLEHFTQREGLANNFVWSVLVDDGGRVWAYTTRGLSRYDGERFVNYDKQDGLLHLEGGATGALQTRDGQLWFSSVAGLVRFDAAEDRASDVAPPVHIENVFVDGRAVQRGDSLPPDHSEVTFEFAALTFQKDGHAGYRYRIKGLNPNWQALGSYRPVTIAGLDPGGYEFQVVGSNAFGTWSAEPAVFAFSVSAPVWRQPWFLALCALVVMGLAALVWRTRVQGLRKRAVELENLVADRTRELEQANRHLHRFATTDALTGLKNRRFLMEQIGHDVAQCLRRYRDAGAATDAPVESTPDSEIGFLVIDLDNFKRINDSYGHQAGDSILKQVANILLEEARSADYVVRWGGDEFLVVARELETGAGAGLASRILASLQATRFTIEATGDSVECRCSIGLCAFPFTHENPEMASWEQVVEIADSAAYMAKHEGGNRWVEIVQASLLQDTRDFVQKIRTDAAVLETSGQIRIKRGVASEDG